MDISLLSPTIPNGPASPPGIAATVAEGVGADGLIVVRYDAPGDVSLAGADAHERVRWVSPGGHDPAVDDDALLIIDSQGDPWAIVAAPDPARTPVAVMRESPLNVTYPEFGALLDGTTNDRAAINLAIDAANVASSSGHGGEIFFPPGLGIVSGTGPLTTMNPGIGVLGVPGASQLRFNTDSDCMVLKGSNSKVSGIWIRNDATPTARRYALKIVNCRYGTFEDIITQTDGANSAGVGLIHSYDGSADDASFLVHQGCWENTFRNVHTVYGNAGATDLGWGLAMIVDPSALGVTDPTGQPAGTYSGYGNDNCVISGNYEGKARGVYLERFGETKFIGGHWLGCDTQVYMRGASSYCTLVTPKLSQWATRPIDADSSCVGLTVINPSLFDTGGGSPWSLGNLGSRPVILGDPSVVGGAELHMAGVLRQYAQVVGFSGANAETQLSSHTGTSVGRPRVNLGSDGAASVGRAANGSGAVEMSGAVELVPVAAGAVGAGGMFVDSADGKLKFRDGGGVLHDLY